LARSDDSALAVAAVCLLVGGWPWALISILAFVCIAKFDGQDSDRCWRSWDWGFNGEI
jgi:hypothetical protein